MIRPTWLAICYVSFALVLASFLTGLVALALAVGVWMSSGLGSFAIALAAMGMLAALVAPRWLIRDRPDFGGVARLSLIVLAVAALAVALWVPASQPSDFGVYWRCGAAAGLPFADWIQACQSAYLPASSVFWRRSLFYTSLIQGLGGDYAALRVVNAALFASTLYLLHRGARAEGGHRFAFVALLAAALFPEFWFALPLATSDHIALPCVVLALLAMARMQRAAPPWWLGLALGVIIFVSDQGRSVGLLMILTLLLLLIVGQGRLGVRVAVVAPAVGSHLLLSAGLESLLADLPTNPGSLLQFLASRDLSRPNDFASLYRLVVHVWPIVPAEEATRLALWRILAEFLGGAGHVFGYLAERLQVSFAGSGYYFFAANALPGNPDSAATAEPALSWSPWVEAHLGLVMRPAMGAALIGVLLAADRPLTRAALAWIGVFFLVVVGLSEVQARYVALIWPAVAILAAAPFLARPTGVAALHKAAGPGLAAAALLALLGLYAALAPLARPGIAWSFAGATAPATAECPAPSRLDPENRSVTIRLADDAPCAILRLPVPAGWQEAGFAVSRGELVWLFQQPGVFPLRHRFNAEGPEGALGAAMASWQRVPLQADGSDLLIRLDRIAPGAAEWIVFLPLKLR